MDVNGHRRCRAGFLKNAEQRQVIERECREGTNGANVSGRIRVIRRFVAFALKEIRTLRTPCRCRAQFEVANCAVRSEYLGKIDVELPTTSFVPLGENRTLSPPLACWQIELEHIRLDEIRTGCTCQMIIYMHLHNNLQKVNPCYEIIHSFKPCAS